MTSLYSFSLRSLKAWRCVCLTASRESLSYFSVQNCDLHVSFNVTWFRQLIRRTHYSTLFSVPCSYLYQQEFATTQEKQNSLPPHRPYRDGTISVQFLTIRLQFLIFPIIHRPAFQDSPFDYCDLLNVFSRMIYDELQREWKYCVWYNGVTKRKILWCVSHTQARFFV
jgi:hypothetical protein